LIIYERCSRVRAGIISGATVVVAGVFILIRTSVLNTFHANNMTKVDMADNILVTATDVGSRLGTAFLVLGHYLRLLFIPYPLISDYSFNTIPLTSLGNVWAILSMLVFLSIVVIAVRGFLKHREDPWAFAALFFLITISLFSNFFIVFSSLMAERFLFFASVGFCLVMGLAVEKSVFPPGFVPGMGVFSYNKALYTLLPVLLLYSGITIARNTDWATNASLYEADLPKAPGNMKMNYNYANEKLAKSFDQQNPNKMADYAASLKYYKKAIAVSPSYQNALLGLGMAFYNFNAPDSSKYYLELALKAKPDYAMAMFYLANIHIQRKQYDSATRLMQAAVKYEPTWIMALYNLGA
jgi:tetratricopeptide (TPR) repeat protein